MGLGRSRHPAEEMWKPQVVAEGSLPHPRSQPQPRSFQHSALPDQYCSPRHPQIFNHSYTPCKPSHVPCSCTWSRCVTKLHPCRGLHGLDSSLCSPPSPCREGFCFVLCLLVKHRAWLGGWGPRSCLQMFSSHCCSNAGEGQPAGAWRCRQEPWEHPQTC